jgi:hypothetical protein
LHSRLVAFLGVFGLSAACGGASLSGDVQADASGGEEGGADAGGAGAVGESGPGDSSGAFSESSSAFPDKGVIV